MTNGICFISWRLKSLVPLQNKDVKFNFQCDINLTWLFCSFVIMKLIANLVSQMLPSLQSHKTKQVREHLSDREDTSIHCWWYRQLVFRSFWLYQLSSGFLAKCSWQKHCMLKTSRAHAPAGFWHTKNGLQLFPCPVCMIEFSAEIMTCCSLW